MNTIQELFHCGLLVMATLLLAMLSMAAQPARTPAVQGDLDDDGIVDVTDMHLMIN